MWDFFDPKNLGGKMIPKFLNLTTRALFFKLELRGTKKTPGFSSIKTLNSPKKQLEKRDGL